MTTFKFFGVLGAITLSLSVALPCYADSKKIKYNITGNIYQRIDDNTSWVEAKENCENEGGYLVTLETKGENNFVYNRLLNGDASLPRYKIGMTDGRKEGTWRWAVPDGFRYTNWDTANGEPNGGTSQNYSSIEVSTGLWHDITSSTEGGYICEWNANQIKSMIVIPDANDDGQEDLAVLYINSFSQKNYVRVIDDNNNSRLKLIEFSSPDSHPVNITALNDMNGNGKPEVAMLYRNGSVYWLEIRDSTTGALLKKHYVDDANKYNFVSLATMQDSDGNGAQELLMQYEPVNSIYEPPVIQTMDANTGSVLQKVTL